MIDDVTESNKVVRQQDKVIYSSNGNEIERTIYDDYGFLVGIEKHSYDSAGNRVESVLMSDKNQVMQKTTYAYVGGLVKTISTYYADSKTTVVQTNTYNSDQLLQETYAERGLAIGKSVYDYDDGQIAAVTFYLANGKKAIAPIGPCFQAHRMVYKYTEARQPSEVVALRS